MIAFRTTDRGFNLYEFKDTYGESCSLQESSSINARIWLGINDPMPQIMASKVQEGGVGWVNYPLHPDVSISSRMHLSQEQVKALLPLLQEFAETGRLAAPETPSEQA